MSDSNHSEIMRVDKIFLTQDQLKECEEKKYINREYEVCGKNALKPNLLNNITVSVPKTYDRYYYYFKLSDNLITRFMVNGQFPNETENMSEADKIKIRTKKLETVARVIVRYYYDITKYFQERISALDIEKLYDEYSEEGLKEIERIMQEITLFYAKMYYKYPLAEEKKASKALKEEMERYNVDEQLAELEKTVSLIRDIVSYQLESKREKEKEKAEKKSEIWNMIFATIGVVLAIIQIVQGFFSK